jgi:predicted kinase
MNQKRLFLLSGPAGCGKSTWAKSQVEKNGGIWISRDVIRLHIVEARGGDYFDYEGEVFNLFISTIQEAINNPTGTNIYVDATHLNKAARDRVLKRLNLDLLDEVNCVFFDVSADVAIERNENRTGFAHVPRSVIRRMWYQHEKPKANERFTHIITIYEEGNEVWN